MAEPYSLVIQERLAGLYFRAAVASGGAERERAAAEAYAIVSELTRKLGPEEARRHSAQSQRLADWGVRHLHAGGQVSLRLRPPEPLSVQPGV